MTRVRNTRFIRRPEHHVIVKSRRDRPATKFVDVGAEFIDVKELTRRAAVSARKLKMRTRKSLEKRTALAAMQKELHRR